MGKQSILQTDVLIIGGGVTGAGVARDLALRGIKSIVVERADLNAGASGSNHGLLHSGARYILTDPESAWECHEENELLKRLAPQCIEETGGIYMAVAGDDEKYVADFPHLCAKSGVPVEELNLQDVREMEPAIPETTIAAYGTQDAAIDPFRLVMDNMAQAQNLGATLLCRMAVVGFKTDHKRITAVQLRDTRSGDPMEVEARQVINATGAWVGEVAALAGAKIEIVYSKGTLLVTAQRLNQRALIRLRYPADADALVPGGTVSLLGPTSIRLNSLDDIRPTVEEVDAIIEGSVPMCPQLAQTRYIRAFSGVRPLIASTAVDNDRTLSRGFDFRDHTRDGLDNFITAAGGKLSTYRIMAEKLSDLVCERLGVHRSCETRSEPLPEAQYNRWTEPGAAPRSWIRKQQSDDLLLCECEMVPASIIEEIIDSLGDSNIATGLRAVALRSRVGKGPCQGTNCGARVTAFLHGRGDLQSTHARAGLREFLQGRWKGERPVLWGVQLAQAELKEALYCGLLGLHAKTQRV